MDSSKIDVRNAVSMLVSADHLKMEALVNDCIEYCYANMEAVIRASHAVNALANLNDRLISKLSQRFSVEKLDEIKDKKDRIKGKLFRCFVERLFDEPERDSDELKNEKNASTLFRCSLCSSLLTNENRRHIRCVPNQMAVDRFGELIPLHQRDPSWNASSYVKSIYHELSSWRYVYWHIWGLVNFLKCSLCKEHFRCCDFEKCRFHPDNPRPLRDDFSSVEIVYPCCQLRTIQFDPLEINTGCHTQSHTPVLTDEITEIFKQLIARKAMICAPVPDVVPRSSDEAAHRVSAQGSCLVRGLSVDSRTVSSPIVTSSTSSSDDGDDDDDGDCKKSGGREKAPHDFAVTSPGQQYTARRLRKILDWHWDPRRSVRYNQDAQREHEQFKFMNLEKKFGLNESSESVKSGNLGLTEKPKFPGGILARLESEFQSKLAAQSTITPPVRKIFTANPRFSRRSSAAAAGDGNQQQNASKQQKHPKTNE